MTIADCILWRRVGANGYGRVYVDGEERSAHRHVYEQTLGPVPDGLELDHLCRNRACVNPAHLEPVPHAENVRRGDVAKLTQEQAESIRASTEPSRVLAERYGVHVNTIRHARQQGGWGGERTAGPHNGRKTHCKRGHPLLGANVRINSRGGRTCLACKRLANKRPRLPMAEKLG